MLVDKVQSSSGSLFSTKVKEKEVSAEEFQAALNEIKEQQKREEEETLKKKAQSLSNEDLDLSAFQDDFSFYAWNKLRESQHRKNEETMLNKLFDVIDANNAKN